MSLTAAPTSVWGSVQAAVQGGGGTQTPAVPPSLLSRGDRDSGSVTGICGKNTSKDGATEGEGEGERA